MGRTQKGWNGSFLGSFLKEKSEYQIAVKSVLHGWTWCQLYCNSSFLCSPSWRACSDTLMLYFRTEWVTRDVETSSLLLGLEKFVCNQDISEDFCDLEKVHLLQNLSWRFSCPYLMVFCRSWSNPSVVPRGWWVNADACVPLLVKSISFRTWPPAGDMISYSVTAIFILKNQIPSWRIRLSWNCVFSGDVLCCQILIKTMK